MPQPTAFDVACLGYQRGTSDKVYATLIIASDQGYQMVTRFGRRGGSLKPGKQSNAGISLMTARNERQSIYEEKRREGYTDLASSDHTFLMSAISREFNVVFGKERDAFIATHPETPRVVTPDGLERQAQIEARNQAAAIAAREAAARELKRNLKTIREHIDSAIPYLLPQMIPIRVDRTGDAFNYTPNHELPTEATKQMQTVVAALSATVRTAQFIAVGQHIVALTDLAKRHPAGAFRRDVAFTSERKLGILRSLATETDAEHLGFYLPVTGAHILISRADATPVIDSLTDLLQRNLAA